MAIIKCVECGNNISDKAEVCPHCGCPSRYQSGEDFDTFSANGNNGNRWDDAIQCILHESDFAAGAKIIREITGSNLRAVTAIARYIQQNGCAPEVYLQDHPTTTPIEIPKDSVIWGAVLEAMAANDIVTAVQEIQNLTYLSTYDAREVYYEIKKSGKPPRDLYLSVRASFDPRWMRVQQMVDFGDFEGMSKEIKKFKAIKDSDMYSIESYMKKYRRPPISAVTAYAINIVPSMKKCIACKKDISENASVCPNCGQPTGIVICPKCGSKEVEIITGGDKVASTVIFGALSANTVLSKFRCKQCRHKF